MGCVGQLNVRKMQKMNIKSSRVDGDVDGGVQQTPILKYIFLKLDVSLLCNCDKQNIMTDSWKSNIIFWLLKS